MNRSSLLGLTSLLLLTAAAHAQFTVYGTYNPVRLSNVQTSSTNSGPAYTSYWAHGVGVGATFTVLPLGPLKFGVDLRGSTKPGTPGTDSVLLGLKAGIKLPLIALKPYVQASGGYVGSRLIASSTGSSFSSRYAAYEILGGVDYAILPLIDLRLIEVGGGKAFNTGSFSTSNNATLFTVATGVAVHF